MKTETYILPSYWASALINNDYSGLEDKEVDEIRRFIADNKEENTMFYCIGCSEESYFTNSNDAFRNIGCEVLRYTFNVSPLF